MSKTEETQYRVELSNGAIETVSTNRGAMYGGALACSQYNKRNPDKADVKVSGFLPIEGGADGHSLQQVEMVDHHLTNILQNARASAVGKCGGNKNEQLR